MGAQAFSVDILVEEQGRRRPEYTLESDLHGEVTLADLLKFTKASLIVIADEVLTEEQAAGFDDKPVLLVDGKRSKSPANVSPLGQIEFVSRQDFGAMFLDVYLGLLDRSKVLTGRYKGSHYVFWNGQQVASDLASLQKWLGLLGEGPQFKEKDVIRIVNVQPYARRLELLGVTAQRSNPKSEDRGRRKKLVTGLRVKIPNGAYQLTARSAKSKYKQNALIQFAFLPGTALGLSGTFKGRGLKKSSAGRAYLYPSIVFTVQERGIL